MQWWYVRYPLWVVSIDVNVKFCVVSFPNHCHKSMLFPEYGIHYMHCVERGVLNPVDIRCFVGEWLVHVEGMAMCGVFGPGQLSGCEGGI